MAEPEPAFRGFIESTFDALLILEACKRGFCPKITRRLQEHEKAELIKSGAVFVFEEAETGIKRWTDGMLWSPSRTLNNFLVYRQLDRRRGATADDKPKAPPADEDSGPPVASTSTAHQRKRSLSDGATKKRDGPPPALAKVSKGQERALVGSLTSADKYRADGLVKKTISVCGMHLISYYKVDDAVAGRLRRPSSHAELRALDISAPLLVASNFRLPPVKETGQDGAPWYRDDSALEAQPSPALASPASSPGFPPAGFGTDTRPHSRPTTSDSMYGAPDLTLAPIAGSSSGPFGESALPPGSPMRGGSLRGSARFDPYSSHSRATSGPSPNVAQVSLPSASYSYPSAPMRSVSGPSTDYWASRTDASSSALPPVARSDGQSLSAQFANYPSHIHSQQQQPGPYSSRYYPPSTSGLPPPPSTGSSLQGTFAFSPPTLASAAPVSPQPPHGSMMRPASSSEMVYSSEASGSGGHYSAYYARQPSTSRPRTGMEMPQYREQPVPPSSSGAGAQTPGTRALGNLLSAAATETGAYAQLQQYPSSYQPMPSPNQEIDRPGSAFYEEAPPDEHGRGRPEVRESWDPHWYATGASAKQWQQHPQQQHYPAPPPLPPPLPQPPRTGPPQHQPTYYTFPPGPPHQHRPHDGEQR